MTRDPLFCAKLRWVVGRFGGQAVLMPNRCEVVRDRIVHMTFIDGPLRSAVAAPYSAAGAM